MVSGKTYRKSIVREIKASAGRFLAIIAISALGVGFLVGLLSTTPDMKYSVDRYYDENNMADLFIKGDMGLTDRDIAAVAELPEVDKVTAACVTDILAEIPQGVVPARIYGLDLEAEDMVNRLELIEGRLPQKPGECVLQKGFGMLETIPVGTVVTLSHENEDYENLGDIYSTMEFTVVGIVKNPFYFASDREPSIVGSGRLGTILYTPRESYSLDFETDIYLTLKDTKKLNSFSEEYKDQVDLVSTQLERLGTERSALRYDEIRSDAWRELNQGKADYMREKADAETKLQEALEELETGKSELQNAFAELQNAKAQIETGEEELRAAKDQLDEIKAQLDASEESVAEAKELLASGAPLPPEVMAQIAAFDEGLRQYEAGLAEWEKNDRELALAKEELQSNEDLLLEKQQELGDGEEEYQKEVLKAEEEFAKAEAELADAEEEIGKLKMPEWYVLDRNSNVTYAGYKVNVEKVADVAKVFPVFFFLVAALVSLTTMTRMVEEERTQIGTLKALGYSRGTIMLKYLLYCGLATAIGCVVGVLLGFRLLPATINNAYYTLYDLPPFYARFDWSFALISCVLEVFCTMGATWLACRRALQDKPALLMRPKAPKAGKRIFLEYIGFLWKRLSFSHKATCRNVFRNKGHLFMTIVGIAGCTSLMLAGFGMKDSINYIAEKQFHGIWKYDLVLTVEKDFSAPELTEFLEQYPSAAIHEEEGKVLGEEDSVAVTVLVPEIKEELAKFIELKNRKTGESLSVPDEGVLLTEKAAEILGINVGDSIILENAENRKTSVTVMGIAENYAGSYVYLSDQAYQKAWGEAPEYDSFLMTTGISAGEEQDEASARLLSFDEVTGVSFLSDMRNTYDVLLTSVNYIVLILIIAAGGLAVIVLYNLTNININERTRELAALRVLGYHHSEVAAYIYREIAILSVLGTGVGLILGVALHRYVINTAETAVMMFGRQISPFSFGWAAAATLAFSALVDFLMAFKLRKIPMVESMKAVD